MLLPAVVPWALPLKPVASGCPATAGGRGWGMVLVLPCEGFVLLSVSLRESVLMLF